MDEKVKMSKAAILVTSLILFITLKLLTMLPAFLQKEDSWPYFVLFAFMVCTVSVTLYFRPVSIQVDKSELTLKRGIGSLRIPLKDIAEINPYIKKSFSKSLFAMDCLFGHIGYFHNRNLGRYISYAGDYNKAFYIRTKSGRTYLFSCENRDDVVEYIRKNIYGMT